MTLKQHTTNKKKIGDNTFYIRPFPAFTAANLSGELMSTLTPVLGGIIPIITSGADSIKDLDITKMLPSLTSSLSSISGDKIQSLMNKLILEYSNVSVVGDITEGEALPLDEDLVNEIFCGEIDGLYTLCYEVIKVNFSGFFKKIVAQFGSQQATDTKKMTVAGGTEN